MSEFSKENLNSCDYDSLNAIWECQLKQLGYQRMWGPEGPGWCPPNAMDAEPQSAYDAWRQATGSPDDLRLGMEKEPYAPTYRKPV